MSTKYFYRNYQVNVPCLPMEGLTTHMETAFIFNFLQKLYVGEIAMIELISTSKCVSCNMCVKVCPTNVFEAVDGDVPIIARKEDCQTCFMCELYCPVDALFVAPEADEEVPIDEHEVESLLGSYRELVGWGKGRKSLAMSDKSYLMVKAIRQSGRV